MTARRIITIGDDEKPAPAVEHLREAAERLRSRVEILDENVFAPAIDVEAVQMIAMGVRDAAHDVANTAAGLYKVRKGAS